MDTGVGDQVGLELVQVDVEGTVEAERGGDGGNNLGDQAVQVLKAGALNAEVATADVVDGLVVDHEGAVRVLQSGVGGEDGVVGLDNGGGVLRGRVDTELQLGLLAIVDGETLHEESTETGTGTTTEGVEDQESLETRTGVGHTANLVENLVDHLLTDGVVTTGVVVGSILLASDHLLRVEERTVGTGAGLINDIGLEIAVDGTGNVAAGACLIERVRYNLAGASPSGDDWEERCEKRGKRFQVASQLVVAILDSWPQSPVPCPSWLCKLGINEVGLFTYRSRRRRC